MFPQGSPRLESGGEAGPTRGRARPLRVRLVTSELGGVRGGGGAAHTQPAWLSTGTRSPSLASSVERGERSFPAAGGPGHAAPPLRTRAEPSF